MISARWNPCRNPSFQTIVTQAIIVQAIQQAIVVQVLHAEGSAQYTSCEQKRFLVQVSRTQQQGLNKLQAFALTTQDPFRPVTESALHLILPWR